MKDKKRSVFSDWFSEYKNVNWPNKSQIGSSIRVVLFFVCVVSILLGLLDFGLVSLFSLIFGLHK